MLIFVSSYFTQFLGGSNRFVHKNAKVNILSDKNTSNVAYDQNVLCLCPVNLVAHERYVLLLEDFFVPLHGVMLMVSHSLLLE